MAEEIVQGRWTEVEQRDYVDGLQKFGDDITKLQSMIRTRSATQIRAYHRRQVQKGKYSKAETPPCTPSKRKNVDSSLPGPAKKQKDTIEEQNSVVGSLPSAAIVTTGGIPPFQVAIEPSTGELSGTTTVEDLKLPSSIPIPLSAMKPSASTSSKPQVLEPVIGKSAVPGVEEGAVEGNDSGIVNLFLREEVQTIIAGIFGFVVVLVMKKMLV